MPQPWYTKLFDYCPATQSLCSLTLRFHICCGGQVKRRAAPKPCCASRRHRILMLQRFRRGSSSRQLLAGSSRHACNSPSHASLLHRRSVPPKHHRHAGRAACSRTRTHVGCGQQPYKSWICTALPMLCRGAPTRDSSRRTFSGAPSIPTDAQRIAKEPLLAGGWRPSPLH
jgi:hypothetical protein